MLLFILSILAVAPAGGIVAQDVDPEEALQRRHFDRYLKLLLRQPRRGTAFDRVFAFHVDRGAVDEFSETLRAEAGEDAAYSMVLGLLELRRGRDQKARAAFESAVDARPQDALAAWYLGETLISLGKRTEGVAALEESLNRRPAKADAAEIFELLGRTLQRSGKTEEALAVWKRFEAAFPGDERVQEQIASILADEGKLEEARARFEKLAGATTDPYRRTQFGLKAADLQMRSGDKPAAIQAFENLLRDLKPGSWVFNDIRRRIEESFLKSDDYDGLVDYYQNWLNQNAADVDAMGRLAKYLAWSDRSDESAEWFQRAIEKAPSDVALREAFIEQLIADKEIIKAIEEVEALVELDSANVDAIERWGRLYLRHPELAQEERADKAADIWRRLLKKDADDVVMVSRVADLMRLAEKEAEAIQLYERAIELAPDDLQYREYLGEYLHSLNRTDDAVEIWKQIASGNRRTTQNLVRLSEIFSSFGFSERALAALQEACDDDPELSDRLRLARMLQDASQPQQALDQLELAGEMTSSDDERETVLKTEIRVLRDAGLLAARTAALARNLERTADESSASDWRRLSLYQKALGELRDAATSAQQALKRDPSSISALTLVAELADDAGLMSESLTAYRQLVEQDSRNRSDHLRKIAELHRRLGQHDSAIEAAEELVATAPDNPEHYRFLADLCFALGDAERSFEALRRAVRVNPGDVAALKTLAEALASRFETAEAIELYWRAFDKAESLDARTTIIQSLAELYLRTNHFDRMVARLKNKTRGLSERREMLICLANAFQSSGDTSRARETLEELLREEPEDVLLLTELARITEETNDIPAAIEYQRRLNKLRPGGEGTVRLADLIARSGDERLADSLWNDMFSADTDPALLVKSADQLIAQEKYEIADRLVRGMLEARPNDWEALLRLAVIAALQDHNDDVERICSRILSLNLPESDSGHELQAAVRDTSTTDSDSATTPRRTSGPRLLETQKLAQGIIAWIDRRNVAPQVTFNRGFNSYSQQQQTAILNQLYYAQKVGLASPSGGSGGGLLSEVSEFRDARAIAVCLSMAIAAREDREDDRWEEFRSRCLKMGDENPAALWDWHFANVVASSGLQRRSGEILSFFDTDDLNGNFGKLTAATLLDGATLDESQIADLKESWKAVAAARPDWLLYLQSLAIGIVNADRAAGLRPEFLAFLMRDDATDQELQLALPLAAQNGEVALLPKLLARLFPADGSNELTQWNGTNIGRLGSMLTPAFQRPPNETEELWSVRDELLRQFLRIKASSWSAIQSPPTAPVVASGTSGVASTTVAAVTRLPFDRYWSHDDVLFFSVVQKAYAASHSEQLSQILTQFREQSSGNSAVMAEMAFAEFANLLKDSESTTVYLARASALEPDDSLLRLGLVRRLQKTGNDLEALALLDTVSANDQDVLKEKETLALSIARTRGLTERARTAAERLFGVRMSPKESMALVSELNKLGMRDKAQAILARVRRKDDNNLETLSQMLKQYREDKNAEVATEIAHKILRATSGSRLSQESGQVVSARSLALQHLAATGGLQQLIDRVQGQIARAPGSIDLHRQLQEYYRGAGLRREAAAVSEKIRELQPQPDQLTRLISEARQAAQQNSHSLAQSLYLKVMETDPQHFANNYYEYLQVFDQRDGIEEIADRVIQMDLKTLRNGSQIATELIQRLGRSRDNVDVKTGKAVELLKSAWNDFPAYRETLVNMISSQSIWNTPVMFQYAKEVVLPDTVQQAVARPWKGIAYSQQLAVKGRMTGLVTRLKSHLTGDGLDEFAAEVSSRVEQFDSWTGGKLLLTLLHALSGRHGEAVAILDRIESSSTTLPIETAWVLATELSSIDERYTSFAAEFLHASVMKYWDTSADYPRSMPAYNTSPRYLAASLLAKADRRRDALNLIDRSAADFPDSLSGAQLALAKLSRYQTVGAQLAELGYRIPAIRYYESVTHELAAQGRSAHQNRVAPDHRIVDNSQRSAAQLIASATSEDLVTWLKFEFETQRQAGDDRCVDLLLRPARSGMKEESISSVVLDIVENLKIPRQQTGAESDSNTELGVQLAELLESVPPGESSTAIISVVWAARTGDQNLQSRAFEVLKDHLSYVSKNEVPPARSEIALWIVAKAVIENSGNPDFATPDFAEQLTARAEAAARATDAAGWYLPILRWRGEIALASGDKVAAEAAWSRLLDAVLADGSVVQTQSSGSATNTKAAESAVQSLGRFPASGTGLQEIRDRLLNASPEQAP